MAKMRFGCRKFVHGWRTLGVAWIGATLTCSAGLTGSTAWGQGVREASGPVIPRITGRIEARQLGLVVNTADPYSVAVGAHYRRVRRLAAHQVLELDLPTGAQLGLEDFERLRAAIGVRFGDDIQALALAWVTPYAVACNSLAGALALGPDEALCQNSCRPSRPSVMFNSRTAQPWKDHRMRPAMHLAASSVAAARLLVERGVRADGSLGRRGAPAVRVRLLTTDDSARNVRARLYPLPGIVRSAGVLLEVEGAEAVEAAARAASGAGVPSGAPVLLLQTGQAQVGSLPRQRWVAGALADHLTSYGGQLDAPDGGQSSAMEWIAGGATASHGSASEPCAHVQKFPHPQILLGHYLQGATAIEAYWKSVAWPQQSVFIGEPLAAPYGVRAAP